MLVSVRNCLKEIKKMPVYSTKRLLDVRTAAEYLSIGRSLLYEWIEKGKIPIVKINTRTLIDIYDLDKFVDDLKKEVK